MFSFIQECSCQSQALFRGYALCRPCCDCHRCRQRYRPGDRRTVAPPWRSYRRSWPGDNVNALAREGIVPVVADVTQEASAELAVRTATEQFGRLDVLINNAGIIINQPVAEMTLREWNQSWLLMPRGHSFFKGSHAPNDGGKIGCNR